MTMTWEQLKEMSRNGIEIGAHSVNHPIFSNIDESRLKNEVARAKEMIEEAIEQDVITFGAPGRGILSIDDRRNFESLLRKIVIESGYSFSTLYKRGLVYDDEFDRYGIARLGIESYDTKSLFKAKLSFPELITY
jgi:peptidoglycan/xylan/chitin deacetylase (PgdA/CDA1 family)